MVRSADACAFKVFILRINMRDYCFENLDLYLALKLNLSIRLVYGSVFNQNRIRYLVYNSVVSDKLKCPF